MSYQGPAWNSIDGGNSFQPGSLSPSVQPGDLVVAIVSATNYLLREGQMTFLPEDIVLPPGWVLVDWRIARQGGDPRRIAYVEGVAATIVTASTPRSGAPSSAVPYWDRDQDPGSANVFWGPPQEYMPGAVPPAGLAGLASYWRGEQGISSFRAVDVNAHALVLLPGDSRDGDGSVLRWVEGVGYAGHWMTSDSESVVNAIPHPYARLPIVGGIGPGTIYAWLSAWTGTTNTRYVPVNMSATSVAVTVVNKAYPLTPFLTYPPNLSMLDVEHDGLSVRWTHRPGMAGPQAGWSLRVHSSSGTQWWNASAKSMQTSQVVNDGTLPSADLPASAFPGGTGKQYVISVATCGANRELSLWSDQIIVTGVLAPVASASFLGVDLSGIVASLRPKVVIGGSSPAGLALVSWDATLIDVTNGREIATGAGSFGDSTGVTWDPGVEVDNSVTVRVVVRVQQAGGAWSKPVITEAIADVDVPGAPVLSVTTGAHETSGAPAARVRVDFPWETDSYAWSGRSTLLRLERLDRGEWVTVAEVPLPPGRTSAVLDDYAASAGDLTYRARGEGQAVDGSRLIGAWGYSTPTRINVPGGWLIDPARPERSAQMDLTADESRKLDLRMVTMEALGRDEVLTAAGTPLLESGSTTVRVNNAEHRARVLALLTSGAVLKLTFCPERDTFAGGARQDAESLWFRPVGDVDTSRVVSRGPWALRHVSWSWVSQRPPVLRRAEVG